jgi:tRNA dimethylallyltransferase
MQVYRHFDIGTGKLPVEERRGVPHHLIDVVDPDQHFSAAAFVELADRAIEEMGRRGKVPVVAGGTGLYVKALVSGLFDAPAADPAIRSAHREAWEVDPELLRRRLAEVDPVAAGRIDRNDFVRISRALEVYEQLGTPITELHEAHGFGQRRYRAVAVGLRPEREDLRRLIERRVDWMMEQGWLAEVQSLLARGYRESHPMGALGYRQLRAHLDHSLDLVEAVRQTKRDTWRFAKRQLNWFSADTTIRWFAARAEVEVEEVASELERPSG